MSPLILVAILFVNQGEDVATWKSFVVVLTHDQLYLGQLGHPRRPDVR
jgi:hypothetical protein